MSGRRWDIFLAYASPDRDHARVLYQALAGAGLSVCFDEAVLRGGDNWQQMLPDHLRSSAIVVVLERRPGTTRVNWLLKPLPVPMYRVTVFV